MNQQWISYDSTDNLYPTAQNPILVRTLLACIIVVIARGNILVIKNILQALDPQRALACHNGAEETEDRPRFKSTTTAAYDRWRQQIQKYQAGWRTTQGHNRGHQRVH
jgi:hypothetical protein